ncbi:uncharacterized protein LOC111700525 [Eurytemora carolleeae]|uniref:uncharacterized protein LOC111700525 n=1 Tax=Eurytemora carolleeae TaxID=1294199 RepID=UPI000C75E66D|nr:uncharacterized protein LOC111700525 [Eurytemora carolleeae]|eukprot:XP_023327230.1 uncharacterized protein LOC111700525 [Eurytemora affinis]
MARREVYSNDAAELQLAQESYGPGREVAHGPWITVPETPYGYSGNTGADPYGFGVSAGLGFDTQALLTWGIGTIVLLLFISTAVSLFKRLLPEFKSLAEVGEGRSLETMGTLAQFALEAMQKYEHLNRD